MAYVYRFKDLDEEIIYVGFTSQTLDKRMQQHWEQGHLPKICYDNVAKIEFIEYNTNADAMIMETYFINEYKPRFNKLNKQLDNITLPFEINKGWKLYKALENNREHYKYDYLIVKCLEAGCFILLLGILAKFIFRLS